jgi:hypothetical protein
VRPDHGDITGGGGMAHLFHDILIRSRSRVNTEFDLNALSVALNNAVVASIRIAGW